MDEIIKNKATVSGATAVKTGISGVVGKSSGALPAYTGEYEVTPLADVRTVLATCGKRMTGNVTVREIPYYEVSNTAGGTTLVIAEREG